MKAYCLVAGWMACVVFGARAQEVPLRETAQGKMFGPETFAVRLDPQTGWAGDVVCDGKTVVSAPDTAQLFDLKQDEKWVTGGGAKIEGQGVERVAADTVRSRMRVGEWTVDAYVQLFPEPRMVRRWFEITWQGAAATKIKAFWIQGGVLPLGAGGGYFVPAQYPPRRTGAKDLVPNRKTGSGRSPYPVIGETGSGWSAVWASDELVDYADRGGSSVLEGEGQIRVTQSFNTQGHMRKGVAQKVGDAWLWLQPNDAETALRRMGEWFRFVKQVPPADRPEWLTRVILYSFHPGGTIGSQCQDLGGFKAATELLPHIRGLGCNAIWLMPLEDKSIYWPRDYYKFQEGLGTPEEYKALTAKAHELGMRVWQDCVPHGGGNQFPRAKEHPEWLAQNEDGSTLDYWCFDFNWPTWIEYMSNVVTFYTREYGLDGFRIDACGGSKIPNWNPAIPYARASHSQAQGGFAMQRALRKAVKALRPDGANLAEVGASSHGAVSDSTYDFDLCYHVLHDFRKLPPEEFVPKLQRWLHEQSYAEIPDLVRMRHVESHDSLRSGLWYGAEAQRALVALIAWIHGVPMVYHEMEDGHYDVYRRIFHVRSQVPELNDGAADYLSVKAPEGVFTCLRASTNGASVVLVNLNGRPVRGAVAVPVNTLPEPQRGATWLRDLMSGDKVAVREGKMDVSLPPFGYTVLRFEGRALPELEPPARPAKGAKAPRVEAAVKVKGSSGSLVLDAQTGFAVAWQTGWKTLPLAMDLAVPKDVRPEGTNAVRVLADGSVEAVRTYGGRALTLRYAAQGEGVAVRATWRGGAPQGAALAVHMPQAERWFACTAEGTFESPFRVRHPGFDGTIGSIYHLPQGTAAIWDSRLHPFGLDASRARVGAESDGKRVSLGFAPEALPASVLLLDRFGDDHGLKALLAWRDDECGVTAGGDELVFSVHSGDAAGAELSSGTGDPRLTAVGGGWMFENAHYRAQVSRSGALAGLWRKDGAVWQPMVLRSQLYTDKGFEGDKDLTQQDDVEATVRIGRLGSEVRLSVVGRMRGFNRFDKMAHPIRFYSDFTFGEGPAFRRTCAFNSEALSSAPFAFLSLITSLEHAERVVYADAAGEFLASERGDGKVRVSQTAKADDPKRLPSDIRFSRASGVTLRLSRLSWFGAQPANVFLHGNDLHFAWMDGKPDNSGAGQWNGVTMSVSCRDAVAAAATPSPLANVGRAELLRDGGFDAVEDAGLVCVLSGRELKVPAKGSRMAWQLPSGAEVVAEGGNRCVVVEGDGKEYRLVRQPLPPQAFPAGSVWKLSARVKAAGVEKADAEWKTACVRWGLNAGEKNTYVTASLPAGDSDWRVLSAEMTSPPGLTAVTVEAGLNGNKGRLWIDDVRVERK